MKLLAYTIYDEKAETFGHPFFVSIQGIAERHLSDWAQNPDSMIGRHPEDFTLYQIGTWNDSEAKLESLGTPKFIAKATEYTNGAKPQEVKTA